VNAGPAILPIAPLTTAEAEQAVALWRAAELVRPWNDPHADLALALNGVSSTILAARDGARVVGTVMVGHDGHRGWLYYLAVATSHRGRGIGRDMVAAAEAWLIARSVPAVQLMVRDDNVAAAGFYRAIGYDRRAVIVMGKRFCEV
jgi:ribosomal protein S18 acetylase RimI-like enzyme